MEYPKEQVDLLQSVLDMRDAQKDYFSQPDQRRLKLSKIKEQKVDAILKPFQIAGVIKSKQKQITNENTLF